MSNCQPNYWNNEVKPRHSAAIPEAQNLVFQTVTLILPTPVIHTHQQAQGQTRCELFHFDNMCHTTVWGTDLDSQVVSILLCFSAYRMTVLCHITV